MKFSRRFWGGLFTMIAGGELILINTILLLGNGVYFATSFERFVEGCLFYVAGITAFFVGCSLLQSEENK